ncbi:hypothetical protein SC206_21150 [Rouxiella sp. T17]|uniref:hypothetical protein n=1 Tax=Rouxiella sp. T17 TaxID=3085684 RepID=UPI002FCB8851
MDVKIKYKVAAITVLPLALFCGRSFADTSGSTQPYTAQADSFSDWLAQGSLYGDLQTMTFFKEFTGTVQDKRTSSFGGDVQYRSPEFHGFSFGLGEYGAYNLGLNPNGTDATEPYLPSNNVNVLGKAFIRYQGYGLDLQAGRIGLDTPFANGGDERTMIPGLYQGFGGSYALPVAKDLKLYGYRIYRFKPESSETFGKGDAASPEVEDTGLPSIDSNGFTTFGVRYGKLYDAKAEAWYYDFDKRAKMEYAGVEIPIKSLSVGGWTPYWGAQYLHEGNTSDQTYPYRNVDADLYSGRIGVRSRNHTFFVSGTNVPAKNGAFMSGAYFAPYSYGIYETTPIENGQPLASMVTGNQPGSALAVRYIYHKEKIQAVFGYTRLNLKPSTGVYYPLVAENINAGFMVLGYDITERLHVEFEFDVVHSPSPVTGNYRAERLRLVYRFGDHKPSFEDL